MWWGAVLVMAHGVTAEAAPKSAAPPVGAAGAAATAPSSEPAAPSTAPDAPVAPTAPDATAPTPDTTTPAPTAPAAEDGNGAADEEEEQEPPRKKRKKHRRARVIAAEHTEQEPESDEATEAAPPPVQTWRLVGQARFLLGIERITNALGWSVTESAQVTSANSNFNGAPTTVELERSGTDVSFLGSGAASSNVFGVPRVALDGMLENGLTLGGSLSYMVVSAKHEVSQGTNKVSRDDGSASVFVFAPRIGVMIPASPFVGIWLRGGISRISTSYEVPQFDTSSGAQVATATSTLTLVDLTLDPQLVINPVPHVGITLGALIDIGLSGSLETSGTGPTQDVTASSYGVTGGLVAIF